MCCGTALLACVARGELPSRPQQDTAKKEKPLLQLKLMNDDVRLAGELQVLGKLQARRQWPEEVQAAVAVADASAKKTAEVAAATHRKELLDEVKQAIAAGATGDDVRRRFHPRLFVFDFAPDQTDPRPQGMRQRLQLLRTQVSFILAAASPHDEALLRLSSPGGAVAPYGLLAAQLQRLRDAGVRLTICVDTVAASGGYMMACVADHIVAAPFATVGSIGVLAGMPNIHKILARNDVEFLQVTGGKYKRTANLLTPNTEEGLAKFRQDVEDIHVAFKEHVSSCRPGLDIEKVATGEIWLGSSALQRGLVDALGTSDEEIQRSVALGFDAVELLRAEPKKEGLARLLGGLGETGTAFADTLSARMASTVSALWQRWSSQGGAAPQARVEAPQFRDHY